MQAITHTRNAQYVQHAMERAKALGSTATTLRGAVRYILASRKPVTCPWEKNVWGSYPSSSALPHAWQEAQNARKADPEAKRARDRSDYRKAYLARLRREEKRLLDTPQATLDQTMSAGERREDIDRRLAEIARLRGIATGKTTKPAKLVMRGLLVPCDAETAHRHGVRGLSGIAVNKWDCEPIYTATWVSSGAGAWCRKDGTHTCYTYGKYWEPGSHCIYVRSVALIRDDMRTLEYILHMTRVTIALPDGYQWDRDRHGLRAYDMRSPRDDFHPDADDLLRMDGVAIAAKIESNRQRRLEVEAKQRADEAEMQGVWIGLSDSVRAGNCPVGSTRWAIEHGLDPQRYYPAIEVYRAGVGNGNAGRVRVAISAAIIRHRHDMERGYCETGIPSRN